MRDAPHPSDPTIDWMTDDVAQRCRAALDVLAGRNVSASQIGNAAMLLRSAADDLASLVELVEGPVPFACEVAALPAFGLAFGSSGRPDAEQIAMDPVRPAQLG
jgi:hypothetical protein